MVGVLFESYGNGERKARTEYRNEGLSADCFLKSHRLKHAGGCLEVAYKSE